MNSSNFITTLLVFMFSFEAYSIETTECIKDLGPSLRKTYHCDGQSYNLTVSEKCAQGGCGLIIDVHGLNMDPYLEDQNTGLSVSGPLNDYIVMQPFAPRKNWNESHYPKVYSFFHEVRQAFDVDKNRLHMTGFSQGSMMTMWFMCVYRDEFASYAPTAAASGEVCNGIEDGIPDVPILYQHGWYDRLASWSGAEDFYQKVISRRNYEIDYDIGDRYSHKTEWINESGNRFVLLSHGYRTSYAYGSGHCFPGAPYKNQHTCRGRSSYSWANEVIKFFVATPKSE